MLGLMKYWKVLLIMGSCNEALLSQEETLVRNRMDFSY